MKSKRVWSVLVSMILMICLCVSTSAAGAEADKTAGSPEPLVLVETESPIHPEKEKPRDTSNPRPHAYVTSKAPTFGSLGSADKMEGTTLIVTIMANDALSSWPNGVDDTMQRMLRYQGVACRWLTDRASEYGVTANFIYDWSVNSDLLYQRTFEEELVRYDGSMYGVQKQYLVDEVPVASLMQKYQANNVIFMFFLNTDYSNEVNPWTIHYHDVAGSRSVDYEFMNIFVKFDNVETPPSTIAHEMLHCFGAPDLYYANELIPQEFVDYCASSGTRDIMYTVALGDEITDWFTGLDAYYVGLNPYSMQVDEWNLGPSQHFPE